MTAPDVRAAHEQQQAGINPDDLIWHPNRADEGVYFPTSGRSVITFPKDVLAHD